MKQDPAVTGSRNLAVPPVIVADYLAGALLTLDRRRLDHGLRDALEQMQAVFQQLVMLGVRALLRHKQSGTKPEIRALQACSEP